jgi:tRNA-Thr(GGU) m(6)t(6)A37 methyltransferase TsaA
MKDSGLNRDKMGAILDYWIEHNEGHNRENTKWLHAAEEYGDEVIIESIKRALELSDTSTEHIKAAKALLHGQTGDKRHGHTHQKQHTHHVPHKHIQYHQIGTIHTPHKPGTTWSEIRNSTAECTIVLDEVFTEGLWKLNSFSHVIVLFSLDRVSDEPVLTVTPPWAEGVQAGVFATRSPVRPNPIGLSITVLKEVSGNVLHTGNIDAYDETPLLDVKPYIEAVESKVGSGNGWIDKLDGSLKESVLQVPKE